MLFVFQTVPDSQVLSYLPQSQTNLNHHQLLTPNNDNSSSLSSSSLSYSSSRSNSSNHHHNHYTENELERMKHCGNLFERRSVVNRLLTNEYFRREPCLYNQLTYKNSARIFHCMKADLNENPILKSLKQQRAKEAGESFTEQNNVTEVPKITYDSNQEKRNTLQLAFSTLKFQKVLEDLIEEVQFYGDHPEFKDDQSLVCTILFDYMTRKFQLRDRLIDEPYDNEDPIVTQIESSIYKNKTDLAAELAKNRIKADALTLDELLPREIREVEHHKAELPLYCWINPLKIHVHDLIRHLVEVEGLKQVDSKKNLEKKCFLIDPHCTNVIMFHYALRTRILNHDLVKQYRLIVQDKSSCLAPHTVLKLLSKKDDVIITNVSGGLLAAFLGCMMEEYEGKVYVYGATNEDKHQEITNKLQAIGCSKYVKLIKEDFLNVKYDESKIENAKVILVNAPCSKSALMNPMEFLFEEGEDVKYLRDYTLDANKPSKIRKCIQEEYALMKHALRFPKVKAIVYQTYSKNSQENEQIVHRAIDEFNELRKFPIFPYKITPPVIPLTAEDIQNDEVVKDFKFLQFKPSTKMNGCFIALLTRDRDAKLDFVARKEHHEKKSKQSAPEPATFQEKNFLPVEEVKKPKKSAPELLGATTSNTRSKSPKKNVHKKKSYLSKQTSSSSQVFNNLEEEIKRLQMQDEQQNQQTTQLFQLERQDSNIKNKILITKTASESTNPLGGGGAQSSSSLFNLNDRRSSLDKLTQIGKLDPYRSLIPKRSSTPTETIVEDKSIHLKTYQFKSTNEFLSTIQTKITPSSDLNAATTQPSVSSRVATTTTNYNTNSLLFKRKNSSNKKAIDCKELTSILKLSKTMTDTESKIYLENSILREDVEVVEHEETVPRTPKMPYGESDIERDLIDEDSNDLFKSDLTLMTSTLATTTNSDLTSLNPLKPFAAKSKRIKKINKQQLSDNYRVNKLNESNEAVGGLHQQQHQTVALKRVQFASDSLPALNMIKTKKGYKKLVVSSNGERINNDVFVPKRSSLDYSNYNSLLTMKMNRQLQQNNHHQEMMSGSGGGEGGRRASPPPPQSTNYTYKEFKLQVLKKKSNKQTHHFGQSLSNIQKRYFNANIKPSTTNSINNYLSPFENLSFTTQSLSLKGGSSSNNTQQNKSKLDSISDTHLNKSFSTKQNTL